MKKLICFEPPYSDYFSDIAKVLESEFECKLEKYCILSSPAYHMYLKGFSPINLDLDVVVDKEKYYRLVGSIKNLSNLKGDIAGMELEAAVSIYISLEKFLESNSNSICFFYNDLRWLHSFGIDICKRLSIPYFVFERGVFRPFSTTFDPQGVNGNSCVRKRSFFKDSYSEGRDLAFKSFFYARMGKEQRFRFVVFYLRKLLSKRFLRPQFSLMNDLSVGKSLLDYFKYFKKEYVYRGKEVDEEGSLPSLYLFVPLQLSNDTQTVLNSRFDSTQSFVDELTRAFIESGLKGKGIELVFKLHPMDVEEYTFDKEVFVSRLPTDELVANCTACITINSTVGFEACFSKKVYCFGDSFYTDHGVVERVDDAYGLFRSVDLKVLGEDLEKDCIRSYKAFILDHYQLPGSVYNYTHEDLKYSAKKILKSLASPKPT